MVLLEPVDGVGSFSILPERCKGVDDRFGAVLDNLSVVDGFCVGLIQDSDVEFVIQALLQGRQGAYGDLAPGGREFLSRFY